MEAFFRLPQYADMRISPDGKHIAALAPVNGRQNLVVLDVPPKDARALSSTPELYHCGVDYVGATDLPLMLTMTWSDTSRSDITVDHIKVMIGDPDRDAKRLAETSPVNLAARIKAPVLMAYGASDVRVPIEHGTRMKAALDKAGVKYRWMAMDGEGHGFRDPANQKAFYEAVEKFFAENLGPD